VVAVRYTGYSFAAFDVTPAREGRRTTLQIRAMSNSGVEVDRVTLVRKAGEAAGKRGGQRSTTRSAEVS